MTTDHRPGRAVPAGEADDRRERLEKLRQRHAASAASGGGSEGNQRRRRPRRAHAAAGGRILAAGVSAGAALALVAAMAGLPPSATPANPTDAPAPVVVRRSSGSAVSASGGPAPAVAPTKAPPVTTSEAS